MRCSIAGKALLSITPVHGLTTTSLRPHFTMARQLRSSITPKAASSKVSGSQIPAAQVSKAKTSRKRPASGVTTKAAKKHASKKPAAPPQTSSPSSAPGSTPEDGLIFASLAAFTTFLSANHSLHPSGLWLRLSKKSSPTTSLTYDDALDAALCYGWIDGQRRALPSQAASFFAQRFHPRRPGGASIWSRRNCDRVEKVLEPAGLMQPPGVAQVEAAKRDGRWERAYAGSRDIVVPDDFRAALKGEESGSAEEFFDGLSRSARYSFLHRLSTIKTAEGRRKRIEQNVALLAQGKTL